MSVLPADLRDYFLRFFDSSALKVWRALSTSELNRVSSYILIHANIRYPSLLCPSISQWLVFTPSASPECVYPRIPTPLCYLSNERIVTYHLQPRPHLAVSDHSGLELYVSLKRPLAHIQAFIPRCQKVVQDTFLVEGGILHLESGQFAATASTAAATITPISVTEEPVSQEGVMLLTVDNQVTTATLLCGSAMNICVVHTKEGVSLCIHEPVAEVLQRYLDLLPKPIPESIELEQAIALMAVSSYKQYLLPYPIVHDGYNAYSLCHLMTLIYRGRELTMVCGWMHHRWSEVIDYQVRYDIRGYSLLVLTAQSCALYRFPPL